MIAEPKHIFILTLTQTPYRKWGSIGYLEAREFPMEIVESVNGIDGLAFADKTTLFEAADKDGFSFFLENEDFYHIPIGMAAGTWSACRVLRHIVELGHCALVMEDDWVPSIGWHGIQRRLEKCESETKIAALLSKRYPDVNYETENLNDDWIKGVPASAGGSNVYTPAGAALALSLFQSHKAVTVEKVVQGIKYPDALTLFERDVIRHPRFMGPSRANPSNTRASYVKDYERWENGYSL